MGDWVTVTTSRAEIEARAMVTERMQPLRIAGRTFHVIGMPYHWGPDGVVTGDVVNDLVGIALDPTSKIHEAKVFTGAKRKGRRADAIPSGGPHASVAEGGTIGRSESEGAEMTHVASQDVLLPEQPEPSEEAARPRAPRERSEATYD
jgi:formate dehydrogenase major subunit